MNDEPNIRALGIMEHIRLRPAMYIANIRSGETMEDGIYSLFQEIFENALDELTSGYGTHIRVQLENNTVNIRDYGRGIPLDALHKVLRQPFSSGKFAPGVYQNSIGLHGLGLKVVAALSERMTVRTIRNGSFREMQLSRGEALSDKTGQCDEADGCDISFTPDEKIFPGKSTLNPYILKNLIKLYCCAIPALNVVFNDEELQARHGLQDALLTLVPFEKITVPPIQLECGKVECVLVQCDQPENSWISFANGHRTVNGGVHSDAAKSALWLAAKQIMKGNTFMRPADVLCSVSGIVSTRIEEPLFEGQTKNRLANAGYFAAWQKKTLRRSSGLLAWQCRFLRRLFPAGGLQHRAASEGGGSRSVERKKNLTLLNEHGEGVETRLLRPRNRGGEIAPDHRGGMSVGTVRQSQPRLLRQGKKTLRRVDFRHGVVEPGYIDFQRNAALFHDAENFAEGALELRCVNRLVSKLLRKIRMPQNLKIPFRNIRFQIPHIPAPDLLRHSRLVPQRTLVRVVETETVDAVNRTDNVIQRLGGELRFHFGAASRHPVHLHSVKNGQTGSGGLRAEVADDLSVLRKLRFVHAPLRFKSGGKRTVVRYAVVTLPERECGGEILLRLALRMFAESGVRMDVGNLHPQASA